MPSQLPRYIFSTKVDRCDRCGLETPPNSPLVLIKNGIVNHPDCFSQAGRETYEEFQKSQRVQRMTEGGTT